MSKIPLRESYNVLFDSTYVFAYWVLLADRTHIFRATMTYLRGHMTPTFSSHLVPKSSDTLKNEGRKYDDQISSI